MRAFFPSTFHSIKTYCYLITILFTLSCQPSAVNFPAKHYRAVSKRDTAYLQLTKNENHFYGHYTIQYGNSGKDSGEIRGNIKGDTLIGDYFYMPHSGGVKKRTPFALLQDGKTLRLGNGAIVRFLYIPSYSPDVAINYDSVKFVFTEIAH